MELILSYQLDIFQYIYFLFLFFVLSKWVPGLWSGCVVCPRVSGINLKLREAADGAQHGSLHAPLPLHLQFYMPLYIIIYLFNLNIKLN